MQKTKLHLLILLSALVVATFLFTENNKASRKNLEVWFLDVGQGDAIFIKTPEGQDILIDGGPNKKVLEQLKTVLPFWDRDIDLVILTHPHTDHVNGLIDVAERYNIGQVIEPNFDYNSVSYNAFEKVIENNNIEKILSDESQNVFIENNINLDILWPDQPLKTYYEDINDISVITKLSYGDVDFILTGDAGIEEERKIINLDLKAEFLKVGHHGSKHSSSLEFLSKVSPDISIISVGKDNSYGHPHKEAIDNLESIGTKILETENTGNIKIEVDKSGKWEVSCEKTCL